MFYPPSAVYAEHEKFNAGNPISLRLRPLIFPPLVISFQRSAVTPDRVWHLHPFKETETPETEREIRNFPPCLWARQFKMEPVPNKHRTHVDNQAALLVAHWWQINKPPLNVAVLNLEARFNWWIYNTQFISEGEINTNWALKMEQVRSRSPPSSCEIYSRPCSGACRRCVLTRTWEGKMEVDLDLGHIFIIGLTPSTLPAYITSMCGCMPWVELLHSPGTSRVTVLVNLQSHDAEIRV